MITSTALARHVAHPEVKADLGLELGKDLVHLSNVPLRDGSPQVGPLHDVRAHHPARLQAGREGGGCGVLHPICVGLHPAGWLGCASSLSIYLACRYAREHPLLLADREAIACHVVDDADLQRGKGRRLGCGSSVARCEHLGPCGAVSANAGGVAGAVDHGAVGAVHRGVDVRKRWRRRRGIVIVLLPWQIQLCRGAASKAASTRN
jgi:hypothetical protein